MRLLTFQDDELTLTNFAGQTIPPYAILSHRWTAEEVLFNDIIGRDYDKDSTGWRKIKFCAKRAALDGIKYFWCDTCCIDKWNKAELARAVNSMFDYYRDAVKCYVYLEDDQSQSTEQTSEPTVFNEERFRQNVWFKRGWTLQELVAPPVVEFYDSHGRNIGDRSFRKQIIHEITGIPLEALDGKLDCFSPEDRMHWAHGRVTTEPEDAAYCLLGILGVQMPLTYGEGKAKAVARLRRERDADTGAPSMIPLSRKDCTIGREAMLSEIDAKLFGASGRQILTVVGESGLGKSHLALEFAYATRDARPDCSVFWCDASTADSLEQSYSDIARKLRLANDQDHADHVRAVLYAYLNSQEAGDWLLVYDNADEIAPISAALGLQDAQPNDLTLLDGTSGAVLVTTTDAKVASTIPGESMEMLAPTVEDSAAILQALLASTGLEADQIADVEKLTNISCHPVAMTIMAAHIHTGRISVDEYVSRFEAFLEASRSEEAEALTEISPARRSINSIVYVSLGAIIRDDEAAARCIYEMSCLHQADIPMSFVYKGFDDKTGDVLATLENYALVTRRPALAAVDIHSLVHAAVRQRLEKSDQWRNCLDGAQGVLLRIFPGVNQKNRSHWRRLLPHTHYIFAQATAGSESSELSILMGRCASALAYDRRDREAEELQQRILRASQRQKNTTLSDLNNLAAAFAGQGRYKEAAMLGTQILDSARHTSDKPGDKETVKKMIYMNNLVSAYSRQGQWAQAEQLQLEAQKESTAALGCDYPITLCIVGNLAGNYYRQARLDEAERLEIRVLEARTRTLGTDDPNTICAMAGLAGTYQAQGKLEAAEALQRQVLAANKTVLGPEHPYTMTTINCLASLLTDQGRYGEAERLLRQILEQSERTLGHDHPDTLGVLQSIGLALRGLKRWREAEELQVPLVSAFERVFGQEHPSTLVAKTILAMIYMSLGKMKEAEQLDMQILEIGKRVMGLKHPHMVVTLLNLATAIDEQGRHGEALAWQERILGICREVKGEQHTETIRLLVRIGSNNIRIRRWDEAEKILLRALASSKAVLGRQHRLTRKVVDILLEVYQRQDRQDDAISLKLSVMDI